MNSAGIRPPLTRVVIPNDLEIGSLETSKAQELSGSLASDPEELRLMRSVLEHDDNVMKEGKLVSEAINQGFSSFVPDMSFDNLVKNFSMTRNIYGDKLLRLITGYDANYLKKNINIPEFQRELKGQIEKNIDNLKKDGVLSKSGAITEEGIKLASLVLYTEELDALIPKGIDGSKESSVPSPYGVKDEVRAYKPGDRFMDLDVRKTLRRAIKRGRKKLLPGDLRISTREQKGKISIVYGIDASGSMKGGKIESAKKAGVALAFKAIENKDKVGLLVFGTDIEARIEPTDDFLKLLLEITRVRAVRETNITATIKEAMEMFPLDRSTKHLILITDAIPTIGKNPEKETLEAASMARDAGITISVIGIGLSGKGKDLAERIATIGKGRLYSLRHHRDADAVILEDYYALGDS